MFRRQGWHNSTLWQGTGIKHTELEASFIYQLPCCLTAIQYVFQLFWTANEALKKVEKRLWQLIVSKGLQTFKRRKLMGFFHWDGCWAKLRLSNIGTLCKYFDDGIFSSQSSHLSLRWAKCPNEWRLLLSILWENKDRHKRNTSKVVKQATNQQGKW